MRLTDSRPTDIHQSAFGPVHSADPLLMYFSSLVFMLLIIVVYLSCLICSVLQNKQTFILEKVGAIILFLVLLKQNEKQEAR